MSAGYGLPDLAGKRVLVTGAGSGIGEAIARAFGAVGAVVGVHCHKSRAPAEALAAEITAAGGRALVLQGDLSEIETADRIIAEFVAFAGGLDVLLNNAGGPEVLVPLEAMSDAEFDRVFDLNARSVMALCRAGIPHLKAAGPGASIINVTSLSARAGSGPTAAIYGASKAFVLAMTKTLAKELAADGIRVNALSPGLVATAMHAHPSSAERVKAWIAAIPLGRAGRPEDIAGPALFLASPALSGFITGQSLEVNGGQLMPG